MHRMSSSSEPHDQAHSIIGVLIGPQCRRWLTSNTFRTLRRTAPIVPPTAVFSESTCKQSNETLYQPNHAVTHWYSKLSVLFPDSSSAKAPRLGQDKLFAPVPDYFWLSAERTDNRFSAAYTSDSVDQQDSTNTLNVRPPNGPSSSV